MKNELERIIQAIYAKNAYALLSANSLFKNSNGRVSLLVESVLQKSCEEGMLDFVNGIYKNAQIDIDNIETLIEDKIYDILLKLNLRLTRLTISMMISTLIAKWEMMHSKVSHAPKKSYA